jgi:hypothetical protein
VVFSILSYHLLEDCTEKKHTQKVQKVCCGSTLKKQKMKGDEREFQEFSSTQLTERSEFLSKASA